MSRPNYIIGIDEAGRGPIAGPIYVGIVLTTTDFDFGQFTDLNDSKQMTEKQLDSVFEKLQTTKSQEMRSVVAYTEAHTIDKYGINKATSLAIERGLRRLNPPTDKVKIYLDGGLSAPQHFKYQETIVGGDAIKPVISLASVVAKVSRDRKMKRKGRQFPQFNFAQHKGYGTADHRKTLRKYGPSKIHRKTYIKNILRK